MMLARRKIYLIITYVPLFHTLKHTAQQLNKGTYVAMCIMMMMKK